MAGRFARFLGVVAVAGLMAPAAQAAMYEGWTFEVAVGKATFKDANIADLDALAVGFFDSYTIDFAPQQSTLDDTDRSYALISGYRFNRNWAMDVGYFRLGAFQYATTGIIDNDPNSTGGFEIGFRAKGAFVGVSGMLPLGETFELRGRAGLSSTDTRLRFSAAALGGGVSDKLNASSQDFYIGAGVGATFWEVYRVGLDWMHHRKVGKSQLTYSTDVDNILLSVGFQY